jgi:CheY-like chemotaxis protein
MSSARPPILIVDDDPDELSLTESLLRKTGTTHRIIAAISGSDAMDRLRKSCLAAGGRRGDKPALVFLDVKMPLVGGFDVLRWIRRKRALRHVKVIMLSSSDERDDTARARRLGADGYLIKFPSVTIMAATLREALGPEAAPARLTPAAAPKSGSTEKPARRS